MGVIKCGTVEIRVWHVIEQAARRYQLATFPDDSVDAVDLMDQWKDDFSDSQLRAYSRYPWEVSEDLKDPAMRAMRVKIEQLGAFIERFHHPKLKRLDPTRYPVVPKPLLKKLNRLIRKDRFVFRAALWKGSIFDLDRDGTSEYIVRGALAFGLRVAPEADPDIDPPTLKLLTSRKLLDHTSSSDYFADVVIEGVFLLSGKGARLDMVPVFAEIRTVDGKRSLLVAGEAITKTDQEEYESLATRSHRADEAVGPDPHGRV